MAMDLFINNIEVTNYKAFAGEHKFSFEDRFTVFIGDNATGKTSVLCAIRTLLYELFPYISNDKYGKNIAKSSFYGVDRAIKWSDVYASIDNNNHFKNSWPCKINASSSDYLWSVIRRNRKGGCKLTGAKPAIKYLDSLLDAIHESRNTNSQTNRPILPLLAYYGTERSEFYNGRRFDRQHHPWDGYKACLNQKISISSFKEWFIELQKLSMQESTSQTYLPLLQLFKNILCDCFKEEGIVDLHYVDKIYNTESEKNELIDDIVIIKLNEGHDREQILMNSLSAGYRIMLAFISDLIMRCITLNEQLGDKVITETPGLVLIDEIDMHLHPLWQRHVVADLMRCFPKLQFIATTHSPFIVQSLMPNQVINLNDTPILHNPIECNLATNAYYMGVESDRSARFENETNDAYDFLKYIDKEGITSADIDKRLSEYALRYSDNPVYVAKLRIEANLAKNEFLYNEFILNENETNR